MSTDITYGTDVYDLAEHFLKVEPCADDPELYKAHCHSLSKAIQHAVDMWFVTADDEAPAIMATVHSPPEAE